MVCSQCGETSQADAAFCAKCGQRLSTSGPPPADDLAMRVAALEARLPQTNILSPRFWPRAIAVWGHNIAVIAVLYLGLFVLAVLFIGLAELAE